MDQERRDKNENDAIKALIASLRERFRIDLSPYMSYAYRRDALANELVVC